MPGNLEERLESALAIAAQKEEAEQAKRNAVKAAEDEKRALKRKLDEQWAEVYLPLLKEAVESMNAKFQALGVLKMEIGPPKAGFSHRVQLSIRSNTPGKTLWGYITLSIATLHIHYHRIAEKPTHDGNTYPAGYHSEALEGFDANSAMSCVVNMLETFNGTANSR